MSIIDPAIPVVIEVIDTRPYLAPHDVEIDPVLDRLYVSIEDRGGHNGIAVIDLTTRKVIGNIARCPRPTATGWRSHLTGSSPSRPTRKRAR